MRQERTLPSSTYAPATGQPLGVIPQSGADDIAEAKTEAMDVKLDDIEIKR